MIVFLYQNFKALSKTPLVLLFQLVTLAFVTCACKVISFPISGQSLSSGDLLFQDDFSNLKSGWKRFSGGMDGSLDYRDGGYLISVNKSAIILWGGPGLDFSNVRLEVDVVKATGPEDNDFGLLCRSQDRNNFYYFVISSDGYYGIGKVENGVQKLIGMQALLPSETIQTGQRVNHLRADCVGDDLSFYINGDLVSSVGDAQFDSGEVGLLAGTFQNPGIRVLFDNFIVLYP